MHLIHTHTYTHRILADEHTLRKMCRRRQSAETDFNRLGERGGAWGGGK